ncbi:hypothetical protein GCM10010517_03250 [Streptosporangium fragile]|uniref:Uncharacterized protein n=1 Tax=Streptosporangium fragile TaxID=46186 RepID=A0ABN3VPW5_9ACTN
MLAARKPFPPAASRVANDARTSTRTLANPTADTNWRTTKPRVPLGSASHNIRIPNNSDRVRCGVRAFLDGTQNPAFRSQSPCPRASASWVSRKRKEWPS